jgi:predicted AAA+ superfamily ATPase
MSSPPSHYRRRVIDDDLDELLPGLPAISLEGAKGIGKTATALRRARTVRRLDDPGMRIAIEADPSQIVSGPAPILIDEYQRVAGTWDRVRSAVDDDPTPGRFILTGSASADEERHSGALRIVVMRMRPLALSERGLARPSVSLGALLAGGRPPVGGRTDIGLDAYVLAILQSGFPALQGLSGRALTIQLDSYLDRVVDRDVLDETGVRVRRPAALRAWMAAYAAATSTTASYEEIRRAARPGDGEVARSRATCEHYRGILERLWLLDPLPGWSPSLSRLERLTGAPRHHLADPALAARLLGVDAGALLARSPLPEGADLLVRDGNLTGALFESLLTLSVRVYAQRHDARVHHLRAQGGRHEVGIIVERADGGVVAIEVKLTGAPADRDLRHLHWLRERLGPRLIDALVVTTGRDAYRRERDGIAVVPAALLGP